RRSGWEAQLPGVAALHYSFPLAISSFHGDCVDVPRGLRSGRLRDPSAGQKQNAVYAMAERASCGCVGSDQCCVANPPARKRDTGGGITPAEFELSVFRLKACGCPFERLCSSVASGLHCLSSDGLCNGPYEDVKILFRGDATNRGTDTWGGSRSVVSFLDS